MRAHISMLERVFVEHCGVQLSEFHVHAGISLQALGLMPDDMRLDIQRRQGYHVTHMTPVGSKEPFKGRTLEEEEHGLDSFMLDAIERFVNNAKPLDVMVLITGHQGFITKLPAATLDKVQVLHLHPRTNTLAPDHLQPNGGPLSGDNEGRPRPGGQLPGVRWHCIWEDFLQQHRDHVTIDQLTVASDGVPGEQGGGTCEGTESPGAGMGWAGSPGADGAGSEAAGAGWPGSQGAGGEGAGAGWVDSQGPGSEGPGEGGGGSQGTGGSQGGNPAEMPLQAECEIDEEAFYAMAGPQQPSSTLWPQQPASTAPSSTAWPQQPTLAWPQQPSNPAATPAIPDLPDGHAAAQGEANDHGLQQQETARGEGNGHASAHSVEAHKSDKLNQATTPGGNITATEGATALHQAARTGQVVLAAWWLDQQEDLAMVDQQDAGGVRRCMRREDFDMVHMLMDKGARADIENGRGDTPRDLALRCGPDGRLAHCIDILSLARSLPHTLRQRNINGSSATKEDKMREFLRLTCFDKDLETAETATGSPATPATAGTLDAAPVALTRNERLTMLTSRTMRVLAGLDKTTVWAITGHAMRSTAAANGEPAPPCYVRYFKRAAALREQAHRAANNITASGIDSACQATLGEQAQTAAHRPASANGAAAAPQAVPSSGSQAVVGECSASAAMAMGRHGSQMLVGECSGETQAPALGVEKSSEFTKAMETSANLSAYTKSLEDADKAIGLKPGSSYAHTRRGTALLGLGRVHEAVQAFQEALRWDPSNMVAREGLRRAKEAKSKAEELDRLSTADDWADYLLQ